MDKRIILLFGMPRSGTTWIGKIFDSHPDVLYRHEPDSWKRMIEIPVISSKKEANRYCSVICDYVNQIDKISLQPVVAKLPLFIKSNSGTIRNNIFRINALLSILFSRLSPKIKIPIIPVVSPDKMKAMSIAWKSIESLGRLGVILECLEQARAIHIIRHPCGYISSVLSGESGGKFVSSLATSEDYSFFTELLKSPVSDKYALDLEKLKGMQPVERLAWRWVLINEHAMCDTDSRKVNILKYEDLCSNPVEVTKKIFKFTGLEWNRQTAEFLGESTSKQSDSYYSVYKDPVKAAQKWKSKLGDNEILAIKKVVLDTLPGRLYENNF